MATLEQLLTPKWRGFIKRLADALDANGVDFAVIGGMALGKQTRRVRSTEDIDILVEEESKRAVFKAMKDAGLERIEGTWPLVKYSDGLLEVDVLCGTSDPEVSALALAVETPLFGPRSRSRPVSSCSGGTSCPTSSDTTTTASMASAR